MLKRVLFSPRETLSAAARSPDLRQALPVPLTLATVEAILAFLMGIEKGSWAEAIGGITRAFFGVLTSWIMVTLFLHGIALLLRGRGKLYPSLFTLIGLSMAPLILTTSLSTILFLISPGAVDSLWGQQWDEISLALGIVGVSWGMPGVLCYFALREEEKLSPRRAAIPVAIIWALTLLGTFLAIS